MASGGQHGLAQSLFQVGGQRGLGRGPARRRPSWCCPAASAAWPWFSLAALLAIVVLWRVGGWYGRRRARQPGPAAVRGPTRAPGAVGQVRVALAVLIVLVFSKYIYLASLTSYYTFY
jgi:FSR family fosmidomycin resistance protein-like MFS transporter